MRRRRPRSGAPAASLDQRVSRAYTVGDDRVWDARLLRWDVLGSLGHIEGLRASRTAQPGRARAGSAPGSARALAAVDRERSGSDAEHEDVHTAVEDWLTRRLPGLGERLHTGRSRNDQVACDLRLYLKDDCSTLHDAALALVAGPARVRRSSTGTCSGPATPISAGRCRPRRAVGRRRTPKGCSNRRGPRRALAPGRPLAARQRRRLRRAAAAPARGGRPGARLRRARPQRGHGAERAGQARGRGALLVHPAGPRARQASQRRDPLQRGGVRLARAAGRARHRVEHHAAQAEPRPLRADPRRAAALEGDLAAVLQPSRGELPAAIIATSSSSRSR